MAQVVAVQQCDRTGFAFNALADDAFQGAVNGAGFTLQVSLNIRIFRIESVLGIQIVTTFGHGKADDAGFCIGALIHQRCQLFIPWQHFFHRGNAFVFTFTGRSHGFQYVFTVLFFQCRKQGIRIATDIAERD